METNLIYELIGYAASILVAFSLMMNAIVKMRVLNMIGALSFSIYGYLIGSIPVAALNGFIVLINIYFLFKIYSDKDYFQLLSSKMIAVISMSSSTFTRNLFPPNHYELTI